jgi:hypothetical protein
MRAMWIAIASTIAVDALIALPAGPAFAKTQKECADEYAGDAAHIRASGQSKRDFIAACAHATSRSPAAASPSAATEPAPAAVKMK